MTGMPARRQGKNNSASLLHCEVPNKQCHCRAHLYDVVHLRQHMLGFPEELALSAEQSARSKGQAK